MPTPPQPAPPIRPPPLRPGQCIGWFSPSSPATATAPRRYERAQRFLRDKGYALKAGALSGKHDHYRSGSIQARAAELNELIRDPSVRAIMSTIGGQNANALLPFIDYDALIADPKIIIGYSDVTSVLLGITAKTNLITFYGPALVASFGEFPPLVEHTFASFQDMTAAQPPLPYRHRLPAMWSEEMIAWEEQNRAKHCQPNHCRFLGNGTVTGRLIGGNLNTMWSIWGSEYMPPIRHGDVLLIEDSLKSIATVERLFVFLSLNGIFERVSAILLGKHEGFQDMGTQRRPIDVLHEVLGDRRLPIVDGVDCCHTHPMLTMPIGARVAIDFDDGAIDVVDAWLQH